MDNEMMVEALQVMVGFLYPYDLGNVQPSTDDCKQYLATHHEKEIALTHAMIVIVDICKQFREGK